MADKKLNIKELIQDDHNFNRGTERGQELIKKSFNELGAGRSILLDKDNRIIAGNKSQLAAMDAGIENVRIIETDGTELIAVKRTDVSLDSKKGRELALADNATTAASLQWDEEELNKVKDEFGIIPEDWAVSINGDLDMDSFFDEEQKGSKNESTDRQIIVTVPLGDNYSAEEIKTIIDDAVSLYQGVKVELK